MQPALINQEKKKKNRDKSSCLKSYFALLKGPRPGGLSNPIIYINTVSKGTEEKKKWQTGKRPTGMFPPPAAVYTAYAAITSSWKEKKKKREKSLVFLIGRELSTYFNIPGKAA